MPMSDERLAERGRDLEEAFYTEDAGALLLKLREQEAAAVPALAEASGIEDEAVLSRLSALGIRPETLAALTMIPIVEVAWADGEMDANERDAILRGAASTGIDPEHPSHGLLRIWVQDPPAPDLYSAWDAYIAALRRELEAHECVRLEERIIGRARAVAEAAGGFLGIGAVSKQERAVLDRLTGVFTA